MKYLLSASFVSSLTKFGKDRIFIESSSASLQATFFALFGSSTHLRLSYVLIRHFLAYQIVF